MPWDAKAASGHTHKANTPALRRQWADVANSVLERTGDDGKAARVANGVVKKRKAKTNVGELMGAKE